MRDAIRVLFVSSTAGLGGVEQQLRSLLPRLADEGVEATWIAVSPTASENTVVAAARTLPAARRIRRRLTGERVQLLHLYGLRAQIAGLLAVRSLPDVRVVAGVVSAGRARAALRDGLETALARRIDRYVAVSRACAESLASCRPGARDRIEVVLPGIEPARVGAGERPRARAELELPEGTVAAITVANLRPMKGHADLVEAAARIGAGASIVFLIVGEDRMSGAIQRLARDRGVSSMFRFLGARDDVPRLLAASDLFVLPSLWEGLPTVVLEAMSAGLPVVGTSVSGVPEAVEDGSTGLLVPPGRAESLASAILRLGADRDLRERMGARGRERFEERFHVRATARNLAAFADRLVNDGDARRRHRTLAPAGESSSSTFPLDRQEVHHRRTGAASSRHCARNDPPAAGGAISDGTSIAGNEFEWGCGTRSRR